MPTRIRSLLLSILFMVTPAAAQVLQPMTAREALSLVQSRSLTDIGQDAVTTAAFFIAADYQGASLSFDHQTGQATGWLYRCYSASLDSAQFYLAVKLPAVGIQILPIPVDTMSRRFPVVVGLSGLNDPWIDSPEAVAGSMSGGAAAFYSAHADARVSLALVLNNPFQTPDLPPGQYWIFVHAAAADTMTCVVSAADASALSCTLSGKPVITSLPNSIARVGEQYSYDVNANGSPPPTYHLTISPSGMQIDSTTGVITWIPSPLQVGVADVTVQAVNAKGRDEQQFQIAVAASATAPKITSQPVTEVRAGDDYQYTLTASGSPIPTWLLATSPSGMFLDAGRGILLWQPLRAQAGNHDIAVVAKNTVGADTQRFVLAVVCEPRTAQIPNQNVKVGEHFLYTVTADGFPVPSFSLITAPAGMTIDSVTGTLSWTPIATQTGSNTVIVASHNRIGTHPQGFIIEVSPTTGTENIQALGGFEMTSISPQPFSPCLGGRLRIVVSAPQARTFQMYIVDLLGRAVRVLDATSIENGETTVYWDGKTETGRDAAAGIYAVRLLTDGKIAAERTIILNR